jgi:uncharacterized protein YndB with AHSA1/START domain
MTDDSTTLTVTHRYSVPPGTVFGAFLDVTVARRFLFATATGEMIEAELDPRVGGAFAFTERRPEMGDVRHVGEFLQIDRPRRLVFSFGVPQFDPAITTVALDIEPDGEGCRLTLTHEGVGPDWAEGTRDGWRRILAGLEPALDGVTAAGWR